jgi:hypothetical protein
MKRKILLFALGMLFLAIGLGLLWQLLKKQAALFEFIED